MQRFKIASQLSEQGDEFSNFLKIKGLGIYFISVTEPICNLCEKDNLVYFIQTRTICSIVLYSS